MADEDFITDTLEEIQETGIAHCSLCPEGDDEVDVGDATSFGDVFEKVAEHAIDEHGLPEGEPWTSEMIEDAREEGA